MLRIRCIEISTRMKWLEKRLLLLFPFFFMLPYPITVSTTLEVHQDCLLNLKLCKMKKQGEKFDEAKELTGEKVRVYVKEADRRREILEELGFKKIGVFLDEKTWQKGGIWEKEESMDENLIKRVKSHFRSIIFSAKAKVNIAYDEEEGHAKVFLVDPQIWLPDLKYVKYCEVLERKGFQRERIRTKSLYGSKEVWHKKASSQEDLIHLAEELKANGINVLLRGEEV